MTPRKHLEGTLSRLLKWIRAADAKIPPILAITTAMLGVLAALAPEASEWTVATAVMAVVTVIPLLASLVFLSLAAFPQTKGPKGSLLYFEGIKNREPESYLRDIQAATEEDHVADLAKQCHRNAEIASSKFRFVRLSMISLFVSIIPWLIVIFMLYQETR
jgi:hypothetical protein